MFIDIDKEKYKNIYAHKIDGKNKELLLEHCELTKLYYQKILKAKNLDPIIDNLIEKIDINYKDLIKKLFVNAIYMHDMGKENPSFQADKMKNKDFRTSSSSSQHSMWGVDIYIEEFKNEINEITNDKSYYKMIFILYSFAYHISKHHGKLESIEDFAKKVNKDENDFELQDLSNHFEFYILNKLLFSLLISSDYYATTEYMADFKIDNFGFFSNEIKKKMQNKFNKYISKFKNPIGINKLRNDIFKEAEINLDISKNIYYLEAPTGSGKTITSINLALKLLTSNHKLNKLFYIFPFNTLVEQTKTVFDDIFGNDLDVEIINSLSPIDTSKEVQEDMESNYTQSYINRLFFHSSTIITTHISLFNILFGISKEDNFPLWQLANSVIILDEIQSYNNNLWWYMAEFFNKYASSLNIKIIIMSATLPKIDFFLQNKNNFVDLIRADKKDNFFKNDYFKKRVKIDFSLLKLKEFTLDQLKVFFHKNKKEYKKILFEFIKKQSAREFYDLLKDKYKNVYELSGDDNKAYRQFVINKTKTNKEIIIVATQVIEAGVDIDMDLGFKDISTLDSEEQFMGRINRSCKKDNAKVYFFNIDDVSKIYKRDNRLGFDVTHNKYQDILLNKNYNLYYKDVLSVIKNNGLRYSGINTNIDNFNKVIKVLDYKKVSEAMKLIDSKHFTLYFPFQLDISKFGEIKDFDNINNDYLTNNKLDGQKVWDSFLSLREIKGFAKAKIEHSKINLLMSFFTFNIMKFDKLREPNYFDEKIGGFYLVKNWKDFIDEENGKFNRVAYQNKCNSHFL